MELSVRKRRRSIDHPPDLSELLKILPKYTASFIKVFDRKRVRMTQIVCGLKKVAAEVKQMKDKSRRGRVAVTVLFSAAVGLIAASAAALFTGSFSFSILAAVTLSVAAWCTAVHLTKKQFRQHKESRKKVNEFLKIVESLRGELEEIKKVCEGLQRESAGAETGNTAKLKDSVNELLDKTAKLKTSAASGCIIDVSEQFKGAVEEFEKMRRQLRELRDTERIKNQR